MDNNNFQPNMDPNTQPAADPNMEPAADPNMEPAEGSCACGCTCKKKSKKIWIALIAAILVVAVAVVVCLWFLGGSEDFLESELIGEGSGTNVVVETKDEMVDIYKNTALPLISNLTNGTELESEYDSLTVTLHTKMDGAAYAKSLGATGGSGEIDQYVLFAITKDAMVVKISTDSTVKLTMRGMEQDVTFTSVVEYYITADSYAIRVVSFEGSDTMMSQQKMAYAMQGAEMGAAFNALFDGELLGEWVDPKDTQFGETQIDQGVASCHNALAILGSNVDDADFVEGVTPELTLSNNGSTSTFQFKYVNNTVITPVDPADVALLKDHLN